ncbi:hypothetical protein GTY84_20345 [Streptomyces sp. SID8352]|nr:hypothetical protein [Streptomyces sp. SID8352]
MTTIPGSGRRGRRSRAAVLLCSGRWRGRRVAISGRITVMVRSGGCRWSASTQWISGATVARYGERTACAAGGRAPDGPLLAEPARLLLVEPRQGTEGPGRHEVPLLPVLFAVVAVAVMAVGTGLSHTARCGQGGAGFR